ncbi:hypothetical protein CTI12_AA418910 [Artemisia annua]|uniref:Uncharacterized protein n=1 Tax=Artemisia annua TaxID=35608 RepID=A0A2U1M584_ARTAN|nr:hypothetical protein CTI12_AA418910 [Artemisia annua]
MLLEISFEEVLVSSNNLIMGSVKGLRACLDIRINLNTPDDRSHMRFSHSNRNLEAASSSMRSVSSESDMEAMNYVPLPTNAQLTSYLSSYYRQTKLKQAVEWPLKCADALTRLGGLATYKWNSSSWTAGML